MNHRGASLLPDIPCLKWMVEVGKQNHLKIVGLDHGLGQGIMEIRTIAPLAYTTGKPLTKPVADELPVAIALAVWDRFIIC